MHVISTLSVPEDRVLPCIECWCQDDKVTSKGKLGGGACCSSSLCPSTLPNTTETTYLLQYNVSYRQASRPRPMFLLALQQPAACGPAGRQLAGPALLSCCRCWHLKGYCHCLLACRSCPCGGAASSRQPFREQSLAAQQGQWLSPEILPAACGTHCYLGISACVGGTDGMAAQQKCSQS